MKLHLPEQISVDSALADVSASMNSFIKKAWQRHHPESEKPEDEDNLSSTMFNAKRMKALIMTTRIKCSRIGSKPTLEKQPKHRAQSQTVYTSKHFQRISLDCDPETRPGTTKTPKHIAIGGQNSMSCL